MGWIAGVVSMALVGCAASSRRTAADDAECRPSFEAVVERRDEADLLLVVDDSADSMSHEQANLLANVGQFFVSWTETSLHVGVVSADLGAAGRAIESCSDEGDGAVLQHRSTGGAQCASSYPEFLTWPPSGDAAYLPDDLLCVGLLGVDGCEVEQPLETIRRALEDGASDEFFRDDALLAVVVLSDEDDCSVADETLFDDPSPLRCTLHPEKLRAVDELAEAVLALKPGRPDLVVASGVVGLPTTNPSARSSVDSIEEIDAVLADPAMEERVVETEEGDALAPSADVPGLCIATPPNRMLSFLRAIEVGGGDGHATSLCSLDWSPAVEVITRHFAPHATDVCAPFDVESSDGRADCVVHEILVADVPCGEGRFLVGHEGARPVCRVCARDDDDGPCAGTGDGWFVTHLDPDCGSSGAIETTAGATPESGSTIRVECSAAAAPGGC